MAQAKYLGLGVPFCPNCGRGANTDGTICPMLTIEEVNNFFKNRVDRVKVHTAPEDRQIGVKKIRITKLFTRGKNKGKKQKPRFLEKPIMESVQKTEAKCGLCGQGLSEKALRKRFSMTVVNGELQLIAIEPPLEPPIPEEGVPQPSTKGSKEEGA